MPRVYSQCLRFRPWLLFAVAVGLYLFVFTLQVQRNPLRADEVDFFRCMRAVVDLGRPLYYAGEIDLPVASVQSLGAETLAGQPFQFYRFKPETGIMKETFFAITAGDSRYTYCLWHPPLYVYLGALVLRMFDLSPSQASLFRYAHLLLVTGMFAGLAALMRELYRSTWVLGLALATLFLACSGLAVGASVLIDYNGALAMCVVSWLAWAFLRADQDPRYAPLAAGLLALTFGVGLGVGFSALLGLVLWTLAFHRPALKRHGITLLAAVGFFLGAFWLAAWLGHFPFSQPFLHNFQRVALQTSLSSRLAAVVEFTRWYMDEIGLIVMAAAVLLSIVRSIGSRTRPARPEGSAAPASTARAYLLPTLVLAALLLQASLRADAYGFPKYIAFSLPLLFAFVGGELAALFAAPRWRGLAAALTLLVLAGLVASTSDMLRRPGGTLYMPGEQGFLAAADAIAANTRPTEVFLGSKDLSFYAGRPFVQWSGNLLTKPELLEKRLADKQVRLAAASQGQLGALSTDVAGWLAQHAALLTDPGDQRVYVLR